MAGSITNETMMQAIFPSAYAYAMPDIFFLFFGIFLTTLLALYVWRSLAWMRIAQRIGRGIPWLAWIPILNSVLVWQMSSTPIIFLILYFALPFILLLLTLLLALSSLSSSFPFLVIWLVFLISTLFSMVGIALYWWWRISERLGYPGWVYLLIFITQFIPFFMYLSGILQLIYWSILAWGPRGNWTGSTAESTGKKDAARPSKPGRRTTKKRKPKRTSSA